MKQKIFKEKYHIFEIKFTKDKLLYGIVELEK